MAPLTSSEAAASAPRNAPAFRETHALKYALEVVARDVESGLATAAVCLFCRHFGAEERPGKKRKASDCKVFRVLRTDQYIQHHAACHPQQWRRYRTGSDDEKRTYFPTDLSRQLPDKQKLVTRQDIAEAAAGAKDSSVEKNCWFLIPKSIVDVVVPLPARDGPVGWQPWNFRACEILELPVRRRRNGGDTGEEATKDKFYRIALFGRMELDVAVDSLAVGLLPRQVAQQLAALTRRITRAGGETSSLPMPGIAGMRELTRLVVSFNMKLTGQLLTRSWGFGVVLREVTAAPALPQLGYIDVRVVFYVQGSLRDVHLIALPLCERHSAVALAKSVERALDAIFPSWRKHLVGITHDGRLAREPSTSGSETSTDPATRGNSSCTHRSAEVVKILKASTQPPGLSRTTPKHVVYCTWGPCRQVSMTVASFYESLMNGGFLPVLHALIAYVRRNPEVMNGMGQHPTASAGDHINIDADNLVGVGVKLDIDSTIRWLSFGRETQWITDKRVRLRKHLEQQSASSVTETIASVDDVWWVNFFVVSWVAVRANEILGKLLLSRASYAQQAQAITELIMELVTTFQIQKEQQVENQELVYSSRRGKFFIMKSNVLDFLDDLGTFVSNVVGRVTSLDEVLESLAIALVNLVESLNELSLNAEANDESVALPPALPLGLAELSGRGFAKLLKDHGVQLRAFYSDKSLDNMEQEHQALRRAVTHNTDLKTALDQSNEQLPFAETWALTNGEFPLLQAFAGGLASGFAARDIGTFSKSINGLSFGGALTESDADDDKMGVDMLDLMVESTLHAQQFDSLVELCQPPKNTPIQLLQVQPSS